MQTPIIGISPTGKEYLFPSVRSALEYVLGYSNGEYPKQIIKSAVEGKEWRGWKFRQLDNQEKIIYEKVLCKSGWQKYGADPRPESSPADGGE